MWIRSSCSELLGKARSGDVLQQLSEALGITIAGADITVLDVVASEPFLFSH